AASTLHRHEQESSRHMAAVASYLASLSPSPSPSVTSIHMCSPFFLSFPSLPSPPLAFSLSASPLPLSPPPSPSFLCFCYRESLLLPSITHVE
ncbi:hypothetical protein CRENBAI_021412, partial [Crenichthys baileyi]